MRPTVTYTTCDTSPREQTGDIITFTQFEGRNILTKTCNDAESGDESDDKSITPPLLRKEYMDAMDYGYESDHDSISTEMLEKVVTEVRPTQNLIGDKPVIKYVIVLDKENRNGKER